VKINLTTLGCPKNLVDSEMLLGGLRGEGIEFVDDPLQAETIILNTCGFIQGAKEESLDAILQAVELKKRGSARRVFVTGCLSQRYHEELKKEIPEVDGFYGNRDMKQIIRDLARRLDLKRELLGERWLMTPRHYAYLKVSEGCENPCTFCSIPGIRGKFDSKSIESLVEETHLLAENGTKELIIIAQDTTIYGLDRYGRKMLVPLLEQLTAIKKIEWIRLLYTYPAHFGDDLVEILSDNKDVIKYVDMPVQHASNRLLRMMARKVTRQQILFIIERLRKNNPEIAIRTSLIVGFPGETQADHEELCEFVEQVQFERLGLFRFSREEDTPAYHFSGQVPEEVIQERWAELNDIQNEISFQKNRALVGTRCRVLVDDIDHENKHYLARTVRDCPEIDNTVLVESDNALECGQFRDVEIIDCAEYELRAKI